MHGQFVLVPLMALAVAISAQAQQFEPSLAPSPSTKITGPSLADDAPSLFQPLSPTYKPLNSLIRVAVNSEQPIEVDWDATHMVRTENDQDRPNLLGREGSWVY